LFRQVLCLAAFENFRLQFFISLRKVRHPFLHLPCPPHRVRRPFHPRPQARGAISQSSTPAMAGMIAEWRLLASWRKRM
jgi:hypothetical protein